MIHLYSCQKCKKMLELATTVEEMDSQTCSDCQNPVERVYNPQWKKLRICIPMHQRAGAEDEVYRAVYGNKGESRNLIEERVDKGELIPDSQDTISDDRPSGV